MLNPQPKAAAAPSRPAVDPSGTRHITRAQQHALTLPAKLPPSTAETNAQASQRQHNTPPGGKEQQKEDDDDGDHSATNILGNISDQLKKVLCNYGMSDQLKKHLSNIRCYASKAMVKEGKKEIIQISIEDVRALCEDLITDISGIYSCMEAKMDKLADSHEQLLKASDTITKEAKGINAAAKEIETKVTKVTDATDTIDNTTRTYRDTLLSQPAQHNMALSDLRLQDDIERRSKQILVRVHSEDLQNKSLSEIKEKANQSIAKIDDDFERPETVEVVSTSLT